MLLARGAASSTFAALGGFWAPAMALLSDASENAGLDLALAFSISNLAWALGHVVGGGARRRARRRDRRTRSPTACSGVPARLTLARRHRAGAQRPGALAAR